MSLRVAIIGCGRTGARRARILRGLGIDTITYADRDPDRASRLAAAEGGEAASSLAAAVAGADAALVCAPAPFRVNIALAVARSGASVFVEAPISDSLHGIGPLIEAVGGGRRVLMVGSGLRFHPALERMRALLEARCIGRAYAVSMWLGVAGFPRQRRGGGNHGAGGCGERRPLFDSLHWLDGLRWLFGAAVEVTAVGARVYADATRAEAEEVGGAMVRVESGAVVQLFPDRFRGYDATRIEVLGTDGMMQWTARDNRLILQRLGGREQREEQIPVDAGELDGAEMRHFLACVLTGRTPITDGVEGRATLALALAVRRSLHLRRAVVLGRHARRRGMGGGSPAPLRLVHAT